MEPLDRPPDAEEGDDQAAKEPGREVVTVVDFETAPDLDDDDTDTEDEGDGADS